MITTKKVAKWLWAELRRETTIQKPPPEYYAVRQKEKLTIGQKAIRGGNRAVKIWFFMGLALIVWVAIHI
jgi:hypothetical protein